MQSQGPERTAQLLEKIAAQLRTAPRPSAGLTTPYINTIPPEQQPAYPGDRELERRIKSLMRWNAMAMVVKANSNDERRRAHFVVTPRRRRFTRSAFKIIFSGARRRIFRATSFIFRATRRRECMRAPFSKAGWMKAHLQNFRQELAEGGGLSSYPHPYLMPEFWQFPDGLDGAWPDHVAVSGAVQPLSDRRAAW